MSKRKILLCLVLLAAAVTWKVLSDLQVRRLDLAFRHAQGLAEPLQLKIAVIGDAHLDDTPADFAKHAAVVAEVVAAKPDLVLLVGDYTAFAFMIEDIDSHRRNVAALFQPLTAQPTLAILGNYETYTTPEPWLEALRGQGIQALDNQVTQVQVKGRTVCIRGLGDYFSDRYRHVDFPAACADLPKLTMTHDPAAAFEDNLGGLTFSGHTHCGQIALPFIGALWWSSSAPHAASCGLYQDTQRTTYVTAGTGYTVLPLRFFAPASWDLLTVDLI